VPKIISKYSELEKLSHINRSGPQCSNNSKKRISTQDSRTLRVNFNYLLNHTMVAMVARCLCHRVRANYNFCQINEDIPLAKKQYRPRI